MSNTLPHRVGVKFTLAFLASALSLDAADGSNAARPIVTALNPDPARVPTLSVWLQEDRNQGQPLPMVAAAFPNAPEFICDSWCYESETDFVKAEALDKGMLKLIHRVRAHPEVLLVTTVTPEPGAVEFKAKA